MCDIEDDVDVQPHWLSWGWNLQQQLQASLEKGFVIRISTKKPSRFPLIDRLIWSANGLTNELISPVFDIRFPQCEVPDGWRFAFTQVIGFRDLVTLADSRWSKFLKLQVIKVTDTAIFPDGKQVLFDPKTATVVKEFELSY